MTKEEIVAAVGAAAAIDLTPQQIDELVSGNRGSDEITVKTREGRQIKANALFEGSSSPSSPRVKVGVFFATRAPELAEQGAIRRMAMDVPYPEAVVVLFDPEGRRTARVFGYADSAIAKSLSAALSTALETVPRPARVREAPSATFFDPSELRKTLERFPNVVLQGPPGTGKTSLAMELIRRLVAEGPQSTVDECRFGRLFHESGGDLGTLLSDQNGRALQCGVVWEMIQLHPGYGYDDLVRRVRPTSSDGDLAFTVEDRLLPKLCALAAARGAEKPVILILDEINRCNLAATLGEFIFAIDPGHRGALVRLQYQGDGLSTSVAVPPNLWIVGTMNTADRSIALVDYAIRRRFRFMNVPADIGAVDQWYTSNEGFRLVARELFIEVNRGLPTELMIGHSALLIDPQPLITWPARLARQIAYNIAPSLAEYVREGLRAPGPIVWSDNAFELDNGPALERQMVAAILDRL